MRRRVPTLLDDLFPDSSPEFAAVAEAWPAEVVNQMLAMVWEAFDRIRALPNFKTVDFSKGYAQLERTLTDLHASEVSKIYAERHTGFESFIPHHEPWEFESLQSRSARPPSGDVGFVLRSNRRFRWSVEAKVVNDPTDLARYLGDLNKYLDGQSSPLSVAAALAAYLIAGKPADFFSGVQRELKQHLAAHEDLPARDHRLSVHTRKKSKLPPATPPQFTCHHLVFALA